jgi:hypothetical protein
MYPFDFIGIVCCDGDIKGHRSAIKSAEIEATFIHVFTLTTVRLRILSEIAKDIAQVCFASVFLEPLMTGNANILTFILGLSLALISWVLSVVIVKE